jgi:large subunit ribosomal protein L11
LAKKVRAVVRIQLHAGKATPAPPVGPALGQHAINIMAFVKEYNEKPASMGGQIVPAEVTVFEDRSFTFVLKTPPASDLLRSAAGIEKGAGPRSAKGRGDQPRPAPPIAQTKMHDLNANDIAALRR